MYDAYWLAVILLIVILAGMIAGYFVLVRTHPEPPPQVSKPPGCPNYPEDQLYPPNYPPPNRPPGPPFVG